MEKLFKVLWSYVWPVCLIVIGATLIFIVGKILFEKIKSKLK